MKRAWGQFFFVFSCTFIASCLPQPPPINRSFDDEGYCATLLPNIFSSFFPPSPADRRHQSNILLPLPDVEGYFCEIQSRCSVQTKHQENQATGAIELMEPLLNIAKVCFYWDHVQNSFFRAIGLVYKRPISGFDIPS